MRLDIVTVFPLYLEPLRLSLIGKAIDTGLVDLRVHDLREFTHDRHRTVDDTPFGGGPGMVMKPGPWGEAIDALVASDPERSSPTLIITTPSGTVFDQNRAAQLADLDWMIIACGRYEGIDARVAKHYAKSMRVLELSVGDYVLAGGEVAALAIAEATIRLIPGVLGNSESASDDSFAIGRDWAALEAPPYTKPATWRGLTVPPVLTSGDHAAVDGWREDAALGRTREYRPELLREE